MKNPYLEYIRAQLYVSLVILTTRCDSLKSRLIYTLVNRLGRVLPVRADDNIPKDISERLHNIEIKVLENATFEDTIDEMDPSEVEQIIEEIITLFGKVSEELSKEEGK